MLSGESLELLHTLRNTQGNDFLQYVASFSLLPFTQVHADPSVLYFSQHDRVSSYVRRVMEAYLRV